MFLIEAGTDCIMPSQFNSTSHTTWHDLPPIPSQNIYVLDLFNPSISCFTSYFCSFSFTVFFAGSFSFLSHQILGVQGLSSLGSLNFLPRLSHTALALCMFCVLATHKSRFAFFLHISADIFNFLFDIYKHVILNET